MSRNKKSASEELESERQKIRNQLSMDAQKMEESVQAKELALEAAKNARQEAFNPYENITNQFANLGVATQAAEFQAEETDIALANTLDAMQASGAGAGGATALAQAALKSKRGISASIQQQEKANQDLAARGADAVQKMKAQGEMQKFAIEDKRDEADIARAAADLNNQRARVDAANAARFEIDMGDIQLGG